MGFWYTVGMWIDTHCHLDAADFRAIDGTDERPMVLQRAHAAGVHKLVVIGSGHGWPDVETALHFAHTKDNLYAAVGVHPHDAASIVAPHQRRTQEAGPLLGEDLWQKIARVVRTDDRVVAVGETGLDFYYNHSAKEHQIELFSRFLALAVETGKPLSLHIRDAHADALALVKNAGFPKGVVHCFTGTKAEAKAWLDAGFYLSFSGIVTFAKATQVQEACAFAPADRLVLETDCPYLAPAPMRGKRNEPAFLLHTAAFVAQLRGMPLHVLANTSTNNAQQLLGI